MAPILSKMGSGAKGEEFSQPAALRRSPRKRCTDTQANVLAKGDTVSSRDASCNASRGKLVTTTAVDELTRPKKSINASILREIELPSTEDETEFEAAITSAQRARPSKSAADVNSLAISIAQTTISRTAPEGDHSDRVLNMPTSRAKPKSPTHYTSRYVLKEANCIDDYSDAAEDEDEDTDLSGFIVDDGAEISYHESPSEDSEDDYRPSKQKSRQPRRRLQRGHRKVVDSDSDKENESDAGIAAALDGLEIGNAEAGRSRKATTEVIDLTTSPDAPARVTSNARVQAAEDPFANTTYELDKSLKGLSLFDSMLRLSPPRKREATSPTRASTPEPPTDPAPEHTPSHQARPQTPTRSPSPPQLKSPSKHSNFQRSPHRQSTDAFWDHHTVNDWHDSYSPKKAPLTSPSKNPLARFAIWSDDDDEGSDNDSRHDSSSASDSLPSPCASPTKPRSSSPMKSPEKAARAAYLAEKRASAARKTTFDAVKEELGTNLLAYLDDHVTAGQLQRLSASTGGVQIKWSKTLRSTAGRANWRRSVTKPSGSPIKGSPVKGMVGDQKVKVEHFANIELAEKVIDCEERLVNTLAHEFCHLANFMVSGIRDQPHGISFKNWAAKATACLAKAEVGGEDERVRATWSACKVTTKHSYEIEWKYLWACVGRDQNSAMNFLNVQATKGCGAEYGRHSKSIDTERMRCGRCKGKLVQVRPVPRVAKKDTSVAKTMTVKKRSAERKASESGSDVSGSSSGVRVNENLQEMEIIELSD
ncbi:uncharacterized protein HMPREF1541_07483 [Cyphellophora europaea CBS 101466]|uniref:SprT-like domain-containing protein n=1 Tax=Cyphellophora europaea (strain CBS 101466) TaxID=1220924 RepID=W2RNG7_CYPE1|nr:uncharacterized protein HMPREF1541_07483 [Cyphellophora europaea CBS 101466]ETN37860.1 hypothetical protein HMPREF1541_07483 [Cyphellophora europaea CBS 101466]